MQGCSIRAFWVLNTSNNVVFSRCFPRFSFLQCTYQFFMLHALDSLLFGSCRRFPTVDKKWLASFKRQRAEENDSNTLQISLPSDAQIEKALAFRKSRYALQVECKPTIVSVNEISVLL